MAADYSGLIKQAYQTYLGRDPEDSGGDYWQGRASRYGIDSAVERIKGSTEAGMRNDRLSTTTGQLDEITKQDSPLMQRAATQGKQYANSRGLLKSSLGAQAAQNAMIQSALSIAQQDAGYQQDLGKMNLQQKNTLEQMARGNQYDTGKMNLQQKNTLEQMARGNQYDTGKMNKQQQYTLEQMSQEQSNALDQLQATSMANAWGEMAGNTTDIVAQSLDAINNIQASSNISAADKSKMIDQLLNIRDSDIGFQQQLYKSLPNYLRNTNIFPSL